MQKTIIYIGDHFYRESQTMMSPLYTTDGDRYNFGFMQRDLAKGFTITIRPATEEEMTVYQERLNRMKHQ